MSEQAIAFGYHPDEDKAVAFGPYIDLENAGDDAAALEDQGWTMTAALVYDDDQKARMEEFGIELRHPSERP